MLSILPSPSTFSGQSHGFGSELGAECPPPSIHRQHLVPVQVVQDTLFVGKRAFRIPNYGRSNLPANHILDHAGVYEQASHAYLHEVLIRKTGIPATLAIVYSQVKLLPAYLSKVDALLPLICLSYSFPTGFNEVVPGIFISMPSECQWGITPAHCHSVFHSIRMRDACVVQLSARFSFSCILKAWHSVNFAVCWAGDAGPTGQQCRRFRGEDRLLRLGQVS